MGGMVRRLILVLGIGAFAGAIATRVTDPFVAVIAGEMGVLPETAALLATAYALPYALVQPVLGPVGDAMGKRRVVAWCLFALAAALLACAAAPAIGPLFAARALAGAASGGVMPLSMALIGDAVPVKERQLAMSRFLVFAISGQVAGGALAGLMEAALGWRGVTLLCAATALAAALVVWRTPMPGGAAEAGGGGGGDGRGARFDPVLALRRYRAILRNRVALGLYASVCAEGILVFGTFPFFAVMLAARGQGGAAEAGIAVGAFGCGGFVYAALAPLLLARLGQARMVRLGGAVGGLALLGLAWAPTWWGFAAAALVLGVGFYMVHNSIQTRATEIAPTARASAMALHAFSFFGGQSLGPVLFGAGLSVVGAAAMFAAYALGLVVLGTLLGRRRG